MRKKQKQKAPQSTLETLLLVLLAALTLVPLFLVVQNSFKSRFYISGDPFALPNKETFVALENYISGLSAGGFFAAFGRSLLITVVSVGLIVLCTSMAAWYLMRVRTALTKGMYYLFVFSMIVPFQMVMYTMTYLVGRAKLNTVLGMPFIYLGFGAGLSVFMLCGFIRGIPRELEEAATIDGCNPVQTFFLVVLPLLKPTAVTVAIPGMATVDELNANVAGAANIDPLTPEEEAACQAVRDALGTQFCRRCNYCAPCTVGISIPSVFLFQGYLNRYGLQQWGRERYATLQTKAGACIRCGACEPRCPYNLPIRQMMKKAAEDFGE